MCFDAAVTRPCTDVLHADNVQVLLRCAVIDGEWKIDIPEKEEDGTELLRIDPEPKTTSPSVRSLISYLNLKIRFISEFEAESFRCTSAHQLPQRERY